MINDNGSNPAEQSLPVEIREAYPSETNFIYHSWIKSGFRSRVYEMIAKEIYTNAQHDVITHVLARANVIVAQELNKPENIYGYLIYQYVDGVFVVHYAYTKQIFRRLGVLASLLKAAGFDSKSNMGFYTHSTKAAYDIETRLNMFYNPYLIINPKFEVLNSSPNQPVTPAPVLSAENIEEKE